MRIPTMLLLAMSFAIPAQGADSPLLIERKQDRKGRAAVESKMKSVRVDFRATAMTVADFSDYLSFVAGEGVNFVLAVGGSTEELPTITLQVKNILLFDLMKLASELTGIAYVYRAGVVMLRRAEDVKEMTELKLYDIRAATAPLTDFPAPDLMGLYPSGYEPAEPEFESADRTMSGFTVEDIAELVRNNAARDTWDSEGVSLTSGNGILIVRQTERGHAEVAKVLRAVGVFSGSSR